MLEEGDLLVGALAAVNALGEVVDDDGEVLVAGRTRATTPELSDPPPDPGTPRWWWWPPTPG